MSAKVVADIFDCITKLEELKRQATVERSHFYVNATATEAIALLYQYAAMFKERS